MTLRLGNLVSRTWVIAMACAAIGAAAPVAEAATVNIDFGPTDNVYSGQGALAAPGDVWNAHAGGFPAPAVNNLLDSTGATTSTGIEFVAYDTTSPGGTWPPYLNPNTVSDGLDAPNPLFEDAVRNGALTSPIGERAFGITLTGLNPLRPYDLAFYAAFTHATSGLALAQVEISDTASFPVSQGSSVPAGTKATTGMGTSGFEENVNYVRFDDVFSDANGDIYANVWSSNSGIYTLSGLQIQEAEFDLGMPGDADNNGMVDINDYLVIRANSFTDQFPPGSNGDVNGDGVVDFGDFHLWKDNFPGGAAAAQSAIAALGVPEPGTVVLSSIGMFALLLGVGRNHRSNR